MVESKGAKNILGNFAAKIDLDIKVAKFKNILGSALMSDLNKHRAPKNNDGVEEDKPSGL